MKIVGLITEYNPFHKGHQYHIEKAKEITGADAVIVVMSGNFVQRGEPAILPKHMRCKMALETGADLVIELPVCYATGSAEYFGYGAVSILHKLGCVDAICFGSECNDLESLSELAHIMLDEPVEYKEALQAFIKSGNTYPVARQKAISFYLGSSKYDDVMASPNNILGIEYLKALYKLESKMEAFTIQRISSDYHDTELRDMFSSASAIRNKMSDNDINTWIDQVPEHCHDILKDTFQKKYPIDVDDFSLILKYQLLNETKESLYKYADVSQELANRIMNQLNQFVSFRQFCDLLKTKEITFSRVSRALLHILLGVRQTDYDEITYAHVLGFRKEKMEIFKSIKTHSSIPLYTKLVDIDGLMLYRDIYASDLYESVITDKYGTPFVNEYAQSIVII